MQSATSTFTRLATALALLAALPVSFAQELPEGWTALGCYSDTAAPRTLGAQVTVNAAMTIERCIATCDEADYKYAGLEFGSECYCDSVIQLPGEQVDDADCAMTCSGDATQTCGGPSRLNIYDSGRPDPITVQTIEVATGTWDYTGCYTDTAAGRTLGFGINIPGGATVESCTAACTASSAGPFPLSGVENRNECWCGHELGETATLVDHNACRGVCTADHSQFCGNANRISVYTFTPAEEPPAPVCDQATIGNFTLVAQFKEPAEDGPTSVPLKVVAVEMASNVVWTILSACSNCCSEWPALSMQNSVILPHSVVVGTQIMSSTRPRLGESPAFVASVPAFPGFQAFCSVADEVDPEANPSRLSFGGDADAFALCTNTSANARVDLVYAPRANHAHYSLEECQAVDVQIIS
ncbi:hypothetical protein NMY22_g3862 [Coprinellus aureogranulatus]|nr:hypothetical protein NMY22_g3862 [Coprinellus aureogranulatus]